MIGVSERAKPSQSSLTSPQYARPYPMRPTPMGLAAIGYEKVLRYAIFCTVAARAKRSPNSESDRRVVQ